MASITFIEDASIVDVRRSRQSRHTDPAWLWGIFLPSCASRVVAVVNTFAEAILSPTRARDSTLAMQNTAFSFVGLPLCPVLAVGVDGHGPLRFSRQDGKERLVGQRCAFCKSVSPSCYLFSAFSCFSLPHSFP